MRRLVMVALGAWAVSGQDLELAFELDDDCRDQSCALNALQTKGVENSTEEPAPERSLSDETPMEPQNESYYFQDNEDHINDFFDEPEAKSKRGGWGVGGDKMWGSGRGVEDINSGNVGYYNGGMYAAKGRCGDSSCALIVNPPGHRSINQFHIHFVHYASYGKNLKSRLERRVCGKSGWRSGGLPCHGKAIFKSGFPGVFSVAMSGGGLRHASVIAWPQACGGSGTIIELAYGCSIEHQIRGDYNPNYR
eukprot:Skav215932  [mRNA]  locus=scaffold226:348849:360539:+ [translate_table: standard]